MNKTKDNSAMAALLREDEIPAPPQPGKPVTGKVVNISNSRILVEIDGTYTGIIAGREAVDGFDTAKKLMEGDEVTSYVVEEENSNGYYVLSLRKASREKAWDRLAEMRDSKEAIEVPIREANKGGLMTDFNGIRAFIPVSQLAPEHYPRVNGANSNEILSRLQKYVGEKFTVQVLTAEQDENKLIFSEKAGLSKKRDAAIQKLKIGDKIEGKVTGIVNFGVFLMFGDGLEGLVHLSEIAWGKITDAASFARIGETKSAIVIGVDADKISLSIKRLTPDPWLKNVEKFSVGDIVEGEVEKITAFGALVKLENDVSGLLHTSEIAPEGEGAKLEVGAKVKAKVIEINPDDHRIALSVKELPIEKKTKATTKTSKETTKDKDEKPNEKPKKKPAAKKKTVKATTKKED
ncbi:S1 RNA-binding domain-containing protein [Candidatus Gracilibacteria bacterium]|nr:S1 RNA-binding domain-containing protein [Candidatus Gracilibacteria bacterium]MCF7856668.1 S1 RNA-binding domain-containing protein [Candidatus Gracilibacteria bacterium]MCF7896999.1 S1 RNA-binding domain-containing protein [Candidatus Gracilibacteria bacterium]